MFASYCFAQSLISGQAVGGRISPARLISPCQLRFRWTGNAGVPRALGQSKMGLTAASHMMCSRLNLSRLVGRCVALAWPSVAVMAAPALRMYALASPCWR